MTLPSIDRRPNAPSAELVAAVALVGVALLTVAPNARFTGAADWLCMGGWYPPLGGAGMIVAGGPFPAGGVAPVRLDPHAWHAVEPIGFTSPQRRHL